MSALRPECASTWTGKDPILLGGGSTDLYGYCGNEPSNCIDPSGLEGFWDAVGKIWALPTSGVGLALGSAGWALGGQAPSYGNNAVEFRGNPIIGSFTPAITIGNVICYASNTPDIATQTHEEQHTYQAQWLGNAYLPAHVLSQAAAYVYSFADSSRTYTNTNDRVHSPGNFLETGPMSSTPTPWPW